MTEATALDGGAIAPDSGLALRRNVALAMLFVVGTINFVDRQLLLVLVEPIRAEMDFSDTHSVLLPGLDGTGNRLNSIHNCALLIPPFAEKKKNKVCEHAL